jgi:UDPglucose 6-dehydrogenase
MKKIAMIGVGKLGQDCAEVMAEYYDMVGYDIAERVASFPMKDSIKEAIYDRDIIFIAAPTAHDPMYGGETPTSHLPNKDFDYSIVTDILHEVNEHATLNQLVVLISTVLPGTVRGILKPCITNARFIYNPYLIAMGTTKWDMVNPEMVIIGTEDGSVTGDAKELIDFYKVFMKNNPRYEVGTWDEAEAIKIFYNTFISTKVALVNMIQDVAEANGNINVDVVANALKKSTQRITGPAYMTPGMGDGGACHPRDNIALRYLAEKLDLGYDLFDAIMKSREIQAERLAKKCLANGKNITIIGKAYKPNVPYTNGSASLLVGYYIEKLGGNVKYFDPNTGDNDAFPDWTEVYLIGYWDKFLEHFSFTSKIVIDPWRKLKKNAALNGTVIHYGNTRPDEEYNRLKAELKEDSKWYFENNFLKVWPELTKYKDKIYYLPAYSEIYYQKNNKSCPSVEDIVKDIRQEMENGKTKIVFSEPGEGLIISCIKKIHAIIDKIPELDPKNVFYVIASLNGVEAYNKYSESKKINILIQSTFERAMIGWLHTNTDHDPENTVQLSEIIKFKVKVKDKKFVCLNRNMRGHRLLLLANMIENKLIDQSFYSAEIFSYFDIFSREADNSCKKVMEYIAPIIDKFPLRLNITNERINPIDLIYEDVYYHDNSYFSIVTETQFYSDNSTPLRSYQYYDGLRSAFLTEKIFRPIAFKHPFILCSEPFILKELKKLGYKTFHPYIDETYDTIEDDDQRLDAITTEVERLCSFTDKQWLHWQRNIKSIVEHNYSVLASKTDKDMAITKNIEDLFKN